MEWIMWRTGSKKMTSICCTICTEQSLVYWTVCEAQSAQYARRKVYWYVENRLFCKEKSIYRGAACFAYKHLVVWQNISQQQDISTKHQHQWSNSIQDSPKMSIRFEVLHWHVSAWRCWTRGSITSIPSSIAPRLCCRVCAALQSVSASHYKLYSRPPCTVLNLCFFFRPGLGQSLGIEPGTDVPQDRAACVLSVCQELEKVTCNKLYLRQSVTACLGKYLPSVVFCVAREWQQL